MVTQKTFGTIIEQANMTNELLVVKFNSLEKEMKENYFWCKIKLHAYALILLLLVVYLR